MADGHYRAEAKAEAEYLKGGAQAGQIFILRLWEEGSGSGIWLGRVQHVLRGDARSFTGLGMLTERLAEMLPQPTAGPGQEPTQLQGKEVILDGQSVAPLESRQAMKSYLEDEGER